MPKSNAYLQTITKKPATFKLIFIKWYEELRTHGNYRLSLNACRKRGTTPQVEPRRKNKTIRVRLFFMLMLYIKIQDFSSNHS